MFNLRVWLANDPWTVDGLAISRLQRVISFRICGQMRALAGLLKPILIKEDLT